MIYTDLHNHKDEFILSKVMNESMTRPLKIKGLEKNIIEIGADMYG